MLPLSSPETLPAKFPLEFMIFSSYSPTWCIINLLIFANWIAFKKRYLRSFFLHSDEWVWAFVPTWLRPTFSWVLFFLFTCFCFVSFAWKFTFKIIIILSFRSLSSKFLFIFGCAGLGCYAWAFSHCQESGWGWPLSSCSMRASHYSGFSCCKAWAPRPMDPSSRSPWAQQSWCPSLAASLHVGCSQTRGQTHVPCVGRVSQPLNHQGNPHSCL